jgi:folate-binding protein YgfZ
MVSRDPRAGSFFDLSDRIKLRLTGSDRLRFINGQITNDIRKAEGASAISACLLNAKGKLSAFVFLSLNGDCLFVDADAALNDTLLTRLDRYIIADDVQVEDVTKDYALFHVISETPPAVSGRVLSSNRFAVAGFDVWTERAEHGAVEAAVTTTTSLCNGQCAEVFRIEQGIPKWGAELTEDIIPVEANLEESSIDYAKGCYIGQEVISRMKMSGQRNKSLCGLVTTGDATVESGMTLYPIESNDKEIGWITSATFSDRLGKSIALGYVKRPFNEMGIKLIAREPNAAGGFGTPVEITSLPFRNHQP